MMCFNLPQRMINIAKLSVLFLLLSQAVYRKMYMILLIQEIKKKLL